MNADILHLFHEPHWLDGSLEDWAWEKYLREQAPDQGLDPVTPIWNLTRIAGGLRRWRSACTWRSASDVLLRSHAIGASWHRPMSRLGGGRLEQGDEQADGIPVLISR
jgi:hypothetical protein